MSGLDDVEADSCICPFKRGKSGKRDGQHDHPGPGPGESKFDEEKRVAECIQRCRERFLERKSPNHHDYSELSGNVCTSLSQAGVNQELWELYWCDSTYCGVWINETGPLGQDPNVDLIINQCQNIGHPSILDPGAPPPDYSCSVSAKGHTTMPCKFMAPARTAMQSASLTAASSVASSGKSSVEQQQTVDVALSTSSGDSTAAGLSATGDRAAASSTPNSLSAGAKAAIGICSVIALLLLIGVALFLYRRRRRSPSYNRGLKSHIRHQNGSSAYPGDSPTPLVSPANSASGGISPLTPPLRLRDRKLLPSILKPISRSSSPPLTSLSPPQSPTNANHRRQFSFPSSPICAPTTNKLLPREERIPKAYTAPLPPPTLPITTAAAAAPRSSLSSFAPTTTTAPSSLRNEILLPTSSAATTATTASTNASTCNPVALPPHALTTTAGATVHTPPSSPTRPPRPHETALEIPHLVGPPPKRALPAVPPTSPTSPTTLLAARAGVPGIAVSEGPKGVGGRGVVGETVGRVKGGDGDGGAGGKGGVVGEMGGGEEDEDEGEGLPVSPKSVLQEGELERFGGKY